MISYQFGFIIPVPKVIVYGVFQLFTLKIYSIQGFTVPADTVKSVFGVIFVFMSSIVIELHVSTLHAKSSYAISPPHIDQWKSSSVLYDAPSPTRGVLSTLILDGFNLVAIML